MCIAFQITDFSTIQSLDKACFSDTWPDSLWLNYLKKPDQFFCFPIRGPNRYVGFALYQKMVDEIELLRLGVSPYYRGQGYARQAMQQHLDYFARQGYEKVMLEVRISNQPAIALYEKLGFAVDAIRSNYYPALSGQGCEDALLMSLTL